MIFAKIYQNFRTDRGSRGIPGDARDRTLHSCNPEDDLKTFFHKTWLKNLQNYLKMMARY